MIREAQEKDLDQLLDLIRKTFKGNKFSWREEDARQTVKNYLKCLYTLVEEKDKITGVISGMIQPEFFDFRNTIFREVVWAGQGDRIYIELMKRLKYMGVKKVIFPAPKGQDRFEKFYKHQKYELLESLWIKELL